MLQYEAMRYTSIKFTALGQKRNVSNILKKR